MTNFERNLHRLLPYLPIFCATLTFALHARSILSIIIHSDSGISFIWDDRAAILSNPDVLGTRPWIDIWTNDFWGEPMSSPTSHKSYRPLTVTSFRWGQVLLHGLQPVGFRLINIILHAFVTGLYAALCQRIVGKWGGDAAKLTLAKTIGRRHSVDFHVEDKKAVSVIVASILFAVHPIHTEPVDSIVGRADIQCAFFYLMGVHCYIKAVRTIAVFDHCDSNKDGSLNENTIEKTNWAMFVLSVLMGICAVLSKELGVMTFGMFISYEVILGVLSTRTEANNNDTSSQNTTKQYISNGLVLSKNIFRQTMIALRARFLQPHVAIRIYTSLICAILITAGHLKLHGKHTMYEWTILENHIAIMDDMLARILSYANVHMVYIWKLFYPVNLCYDYGWNCISPVMSLIDMRNIYPLIIYSSILNLVFNSLLTKDIPMLWSVALSVVPFVPASNVFFPIGTVLAERLLYMPSMGFCLGIALTFSEMAYSEKISRISTFVTKKLPKGFQKKIYNILSMRRIPLKISLFIFSLIVTRMVIITFTRSTDWNTENALFLSALNVCPTSLKVMNNAAMTIWHDNATHAAELLNSVIENHPSYFSAHFNRGLVYHKMEEYDLAIASFDRCLDIIPGHVKSSIHISQAKLSLYFELKREGRYVEARSIIQECYDHVAPLISDGVEQPLAYYLQCAAGHEIGTNGHDSLTHCQMAIELNRQKRNSSNKFEVDFVSEEVVFNTAGLILVSMNRTEDAAKYYEEGLTVNPTFFGLLVNAGGLATDMGHYELAMRYFEAALSENPDRAELVANIGYLHEVQGKLQEAHAYYMKAMGLMAPYIHPQIETNLRNIKRQMNEPVTLSSLYRTVE